MPRKLITSFSYLFFACKCTGLTAYTFKRNVANQCIIFKRNSLGRFINCLYVLITLLTFLSTTNCFEEDNAIESTSSHIAMIIYGSYFSALILTLNFKQTRVVTTFYKIVYFKVMIQKILKRNIDTFNLSRILRYYVFIRTGSIILMFICNVSLAFVTELSDLVCAIKLLFITIITGTGEYLIFCYLMTTSIILKQLNNSLKELKTISFNDTKNILQFYFDLKKDIQNISQIFVFFKVIYSTVQLAAILYQLLTQEEDDDWTLSAQIYNFATVFCWFLTVTLEMLLMLYPFVHYYEQVKRKINDLILLINLF
jgi:hypothetical protein